LVDVVGERAHTRDIAAGPVQVGNQTDLDRVRAHEKDDRDALRRGFGRKRSRRRDRHDHIHLARDQLGCHRRQPLVAAFSPAIVHRDVPPGNIACLTETLMKGRDILFPLVECGETDEADQWPGWLRTRCQRRERQAPECRDELAPSHPITSLAPSSSGARTCVIRAPYAGTAPS
jgi:hypothetical protein